LRSELLHEYTQFGVQKIRRKTGSVRLYLPQAILVILPALAIAAFVGSWFCAFHAEDEAWHRCALEPGEEGGED
jgi:hypothetical protein